MTKKNFPAVSVIIPMFNAEKYIADCLNSIFAQTLQDFEILVVDDCSTDKSRAIVENFYLAFGDRLKLMKLSRNNGCPATPRNFALKAAKGKYVYFLDSDDFLSETALEDFFKVAEEFNADVVHSEKWFEFFDERDKSSDKPCYFKTGVFVTEPTLETFDVGERLVSFVQKKFLWWACNKLFRRQLLVDNNITFTDLNNFEDFVFVFKCLVTAKNYVRVPFVSYHYRIRNDSLSHKITYGADLMSDIIGVVKGIDSFMRDKKFFADNPQYRYLVTDFFMQERLEVFAKEILLEGNNDISTVYDFLCNEIFSHKHKDSVALSSYLFISASIFKLHIAQQAAEIDKLKRLLKENRT